LLITSNYEILKVLFFTEDIVHASLSDQPVQVLVSISLMCNWPKQAITVPPHFNYTQLLCLKLLFEPSFFSFPVYSLIVEVIMLLFLFGMKLNSPPSAIYELLRMISLELLLSLLSAVYLFLLHS
jgi:hypothetical protein